ncbi:MAG TPA: GNAT family N-acetyltransferase [Chitinophagaceae bacterium]
MTTGNQIKYLQYKEIDKAKWDACITNAPNGLIYGYSFYLDCMARHWDALVLGDYEAVMPLIWNKKYGFYYMYQPAFTASLGVFGRNLTKGIIDDFVSMLPSKFRLVEISLNSGNIVGDSKSFSLLSSNYILHLNSSYEEISKTYRDNHNRNIKKAFQLGCSVSKLVSVDEIIQLNKEQLQHIDGTKPEDYPNFKKLYELLKNKGQAKTYGILDKQNKILASAVFFFSHNRAYYIMVGNHPDGKTIGASHALIEAFIKDHADQNLILDFEGSDIRNLAFFYSGFGATEEIYPALKINKLPWYIRLLKK